MMLTLALVAGLPPVPEPQAGPEKAWAIELRGYTYHPQAKGWIVEVHGFTKHRKPAEPPMRWSIQWRQFRPANAPFPQVEAQYHEDLSAFFAPLQVPSQADAVDGVYVEDLSAFFNQLKQR
jgi:hypothetical protein